MITLFEILPIQPNPRQKFQQEVLSLCQFLARRDGFPYRYEVFSLLLISGHSFKQRNYRTFKQHPQAQRFLRMHIADVTAIAIMDELDKIYGRADENEIDHLRGAVGEVFAYMICRRKHRKAALEAKVKIDKWTSESIDAVGCSAESGHCLQSKYSPRQWDVVLRQQKDLESIETLTQGRAVGAFIVYGDRRGFNLQLIDAGLDPSSVKVFDRQDLINLEGCIAV